MNSLVRRQTLGDLLRRSAARAPHKLAIACGDIAGPTREFDAICRSPGGGTADAGRAQGRRGRHPRAQLACLCRAAICAGAARRGAGADQFHAEGGRSRLHPAPCRREDAGDRQRLARSRAQASAHDTARRASDLAARRRSRASAGRHDRLRCAGRLRRPQSPEVDLDGSDLAQIVYTSGTESLPKGAMLTHDAVMWQYVSCIVDAGIAGERPACCTPCRCITARSSTCSSALRSMSARPTSSPAKPTPEQSAAADRAPPHHLVLRAADGLDRAAALAAVRHDRPVQPATRATTAPRSCRSKCCARWHSACPRCGCGTSTARPRSRRSRRCCGPRISCASPARADARCSMSRRAWWMTRCSDVARRRSRRDRASLAAFAARLLPRRRTHGGRVRGRLVPLRRPRHHR